MVALVADVSISNNHCNQNKPMKIEVEPGLMLKMLDLSDSKYIFETIDSQREYLGRWLPFVEFTKEIADTQKFVDSVVNAPEDGFEYVFS